MIGNFRDWHGQKWVCPVMWSDFKIDCTWRMNRWNILVFCMLIQIHKNSLDVHGPKWVWLVWSRNTKIGFISKMNCLSKMIFYMLVQIQESWKLIERFLGGIGQKWQLPFSSWDREICCNLRMDIWIEQIFLMLMVML